MKTIVAGSRGWNNYEGLARQLDKLEPKISILVSGTAAGADRLGERWAQERGISVECYPANWRAHGRRAGFIRNATMAAVSDRLVAFWDGQSRGTKNMIETASNHGLVLIVFTEGDCA